MIGATIDFALTNASWSFADLSPMHQRQRVVAFIGALTVVIVVFELVRRRKLREEYSWVWIATAGAVTLLGLNQDLLMWLTKLIGAASSASTMFFGAIVFLLALCIQFSIRLSRLTHRQRTLAQRMALLEEEVGELRRRAKRDAPAKAQRGGKKDEVA